MREHVFEFLSRTEVMSGALALAAFVSLYWMLRGAPPGQKLRETAAAEGGPGHAYRDGMVAACVLGLLFVLAAAVVAFQAGIPWSLPLFAAGFGIEFAVARANRKYRHSSPTLRRVVQFSETALTGSLLAGILIVGNVLAFRYGERPFDLTHDRAFSLSELTVKQLRSLRRPVRFTILYGNSEFAVKASSRVQQLLELYKGENPEKVEVEHLNFRVEPVKFRELTERIPDVAMAAGQGGGVLVEYGEGEGATTAVVRNADLFGQPEDAPIQAGSARFETEFRGEDALTSALIRLREGKKMKVAFVTGHGEPSIHEMDWNSEGLGRLRARLEAIGAEIVVQNLVRDALPEDTECVFVVAPQTPFETRELERLKDYLADGGRFILVLDGRVQTGLEPWLKGFNTELGNQTITDSSYSMPGRPELPYAPIVGDSRSPIVEPLRNQMVVVPVAVPITVLSTNRTGQAPRADANPLAQAEVILRTSPESQMGAPAGAAASSERETPRMGPFAVGVAVSGLTPEKDEPPTPRMVVFSSPYMAGNNFVGRSPANLDILVNAVNWLRGRPDLQGIPPKRHVALTLTVDPAMRGKLVLIPSLMAFATIIGLGIATYLARRS